MRSLYLEAPATLDNPADYEWHESDAIFLAGSITGAEPWQEHATNRLLPYYHVWNPRRKGLATLPPEIEFEQIKWEYDHLGCAKTILFWFSDKSLAPITLFELGTLLWEARVGQIKLYIGIHPNYARKNDILIQTQLRAPNVLPNIYDSLDGMLDAIIKDKTCT